MPGTVQVSILELTGLPSSKSPSSISIKVSLGKNTYETEGEEADFLFPLATLRDNLVVKIHDTQGNEIAHTGIKCRLIAEKGSWDDLFPLEGGGQIHMRLTFSLSEEERNKIRTMREIALRKKQEELLNKNRAMVVSSGGRNEMPSTAKISDKVQSLALPLEASSRIVSSKSSKTLSNSSASKQVKEDDQPYNWKEQNQAPSKVKGDDQPYNSKGQRPLENTPSKLQEHDQPYSSKKQGLLEYTATKLKEDAQPYKLKAQNPLEKEARKSKDDDQCYSTKKQNPLEKTSSKVRETIAAFESSRRTQGLMTTSKAQSGIDMSGPHPKEETSYEPKDVVNSNYKPKEKDPLHYIFESEERDPSQQLHRPSNLEQKKISGGNHDSSDTRRRCSCFNFHGWMFLEESICSCIVSDSRLVIDLLGDYSVNPRTYPGKLVDEEVSSSKDDGFSRTNKKPDSGPGASKGPNGQLMKIVIMVGFGLLVLFTRQKKSR